MGSQTPTKTEKADETSPSSTENPPAKKRRSRWRKLGIFLLFLAILIGIGRAMLPWALRSYVNRTIDQSPLYDGKIGDIEVHLYRGAYTIKDVRLIKTTGSVPVPLFAAKQVDLAIEWPALLNRKLVGRVVMVSPELNFVDAPSEGEAQSGAGGPWLKILNDLSPFKINSVKIHDGSVHFRTFTSEEPVDVYLSQLEASIDNLTNIRDEIAPLITTITATGLAMDQAKFEYQMRMNPFSYRPTFHMAVRLLGLDVTKTNNLARAYGAFDFESGWFDLVIEMDVKEGLVEGYVKPLFRNLKVFSLRKDIREDNVLELFWEAMVGVATNLLKNPPRDQLATLVPFRGDMSGPQTDVLAAIGNVLRNAFIRAYLPRLQTGEQGVEGLEFGPPTLADPVQVGD
ncbi:MAG: DUF748 domain-containing protein [Anaerolineae bacterium]|nr:DUF748 domain-containing protein [Phycisphaerae bacterium]